MRINPLIGGIDHFGYFFIGHDTLRGICAYSYYPGSEQSGFCLSISLYYGMAINCKLLAVPVLKSL
jgi:hypothetical protein